MHNGFYQLNMPPRSTIPNTTTSISQESLWPQSSQTLEMLKDINNQEQFSYLFSKTLYGFFFASSNNYATVENITLNTTTSTLGLLWHRRLGHPHSSVLKSLVVEMNVTDGIINKIQFCEACQYGKLHQSSLPISNSRSHEPFELVFADV